MTEDHSHTAPHDAHANGDGGRCDAGSPRRDSPGGANATEPGGNAPLPSPFGAGLEPILNQSCGGRLGKITWFRTDWQRGGALTGYAGYRGDDSAELPVVVKLPVPPGERRWLIQLQGSDVAPRLYAHGEQLNGYDMAWVVMERLPHGPLNCAAWGGAAFDLLVDAVVRFWSATRDVPLKGEVRLRDYEAIREEARESIHLHGVANEQRWNKALKKGHQRMREWIPMWNDRAAECWCHGDLHLGNAMTRVAAPNGPAVLLDFAEVHRGHWVEDAVNLEHLYWARRDRLEGRKICKQIARQRKAMGLQVEEDWAKLAAIYRGLVAMCTPAILRHVGDPLHVEAALEVLEAQVS